ncbi:MAG: hypothetical protein L6W00_17555 [Lentisphaeria bacterium]|nr:MAG: hypothetical protein L6W00_17555 [Lentisphaeria bacterium]
MDVQLPQNGELLPLTVLLILEDASGKELLVEGGGELYWFHDRVRKWRCVDSQPVRHRIHSQRPWRGREEEYYSLPVVFQWVDFKSGSCSVRLAVPGGSSVGRGKVMINNLRVQYFNGRK